MYLRKSANNNKLNTIANIPLINNRGLSRRNNIISFIINCIRKTVLEINQKKQSTEFPLCHCSNYHWSSAEIA